MDDFDSQDFNKLFWEWFDSIPRADRKRFQEHSADMAKIYYYNKFYRKRDSSSVAEHFVANEDVVGSIPTYRSKSLEKHET